MGCPVIVYGDIPIIPFIGDLIGGAVGWAWDRVTGGLAAWVMGAVGDVVGGVVTFLGATTAVDPTAVWFSGDGSAFATMRSIAVVVMVGLVLVAVIGGLIAGDVAATARHLVVAIPGAVFGIGAITVCTAKLLALTDAFTAQVLAGGSSSGFLTQFAAGAANTGQGFATVLVGAVAVLGGLAVWAELVVRSALIYMLVALSPLAFASIVWPTCRHVARRLIELLVAMIVSKFIIAVTLGVGVAALTHQTDASAAKDLGTLLVGAVILCLAAFAPFLVLRLLPVLEAAVVAQGLSRAPLQATRAVIAASVSANNLTRLTTGAASTRAETTGPHATADRVPARLRPSSVTETVARR